MTYSFALAPVHDVLAHARPGLCYPDGSLVPRTVFFGAMHGAGQRLLKAYGSAALRPHVASILAAPRAAARPALASLSSDDPVAHWVAQAVAWAYKRQDGDRHCPFDVAELLAAAVLLHGDHARHTGGDGHAAEEAERTAQRTALAPEPTRR